MQTIMKKYKKAVLIPIMKYYGQCRSEWGKSVLPDDITDVNVIEKMIDLRAIVVHDAERYGQNDIALYYNCTWDEEEGLGVSMKGFDVLEVGTQGSIK